jgi:hypothetical protein
MIIFYMILFAAASLSPFLLFDHGRADAEKANKTSG